MLLKMIMPREKNIEDFADNHSVFSMILFQILIAVGMLAVVGGVALAGGGVIWLFYHMMGVM